jgi:hypothetical protein
MLLMVLSIGGTILGATTIAGILMLYQIRSATDFTNSAKAVFAADAATEWAQYNYSLVTSTVPIALLPFSNGASSSVECYDVNGGDLGACDQFMDPLSSSTASYAIARGASLNTKRAFFVGF